jgi:hypothetical protein
MVSILQLIDFSRLLIYSGFPLGKIANPKYSFFYNGVILFYASGRLHFSGYPCLNLRSEVEAKTEVGDGQ